MTISGAGAPLPTYTTGPVIATPLDYETVQVTWQNPASGSRVQLVRNSRSISADPLDGTVLASMPVGGATQFVDQLLAMGNFGGTLVYYSTWVQDSTGNWWRGGDVEVPVPKDWGNAALLWNRLPAWFRYLDDQLTTT